MGLFKIWHFKNFCSKMKIDGEMASDQKYSHIEGSLTLQHWRICGNKNFPLAKKLVILRPSPNNFIIFYKKFCCGWASWTLFITRNEGQSYKQVHRPYPIKSGLRVPSSLAALAIAILQDLRSAPEPPPINKGNSKFFQKGRKRKTDLWASVKSEERSASEVWLDWRSE